MTARDEILANLRHALADPGLRFPPTAPEPLTAATRLTVTQATGTKAELAARFGAELVQLHGSFQVVGSVPEARLALITKLLEWAEDEANARKGAQLETHQERMVLCWDAAALPVPAIREALTDMRFALITPSDLAGAEARDRIRYIRFGVTGVEAAFATTASMLMTTSAQTNRVASLLPLRHIALIPFSRLYPTSEDWLRAQRTADNLVDLYRQHANLTMISGPSKSADIEMNLTLGVHGPKFVHAILFDNQEG